jgi:hypothetical protein
VLVVPPTAAVAAEPVPAGRNGATPG